MKKKIVRQWLSISLSVMLILTMAPGVFAADNEAPKLETLTSNPQLVAEKISPELYDAFKSDKYVTYLIKMVEQVDTGKVSKQAQSLNKHETPAMQRLAMRTAVIHSLKEMALKTQVGVTKFLEKMEKSGEVQQFESFYIINGMLITSTQEVMEKIAHYPEVEQILPNRTHTLDVVEKTTTLNSEQSLNAQLNNIEWNIAQVNAPDVWAMGIDGSGIVVANMDSGVDLNHPALNRKWRGHDVDDFNLSWFDGTTNSTQPVDGHGHGTHVMGTMVGSEEDGSNQIGVAPGATWIAARIFDSAGNTSDAIIIRGAQWILNPKDSNGIERPEMAPDVVNNSWGNVAPGKDEFLRPLVEAWRDSGIFPNFSAGNTRPPINNGGPGSITPPANYPESFAVAATDSNKNLAGFSLRGPTPYGEMKPDISAPGVNVRSSVPGGRYEGGWNGTSMASPHIAGAVALMLQANASLTIDELETVLKNTAEPLTNNEYSESPNHGFGAGLLDAYAAVSAVADGLGTISGHVTIAGEDTEAPTYQHTPVTEAYSGFDIPLTIQVSDNISITSVEGFARQVGDDEWTVLPMQRSSGDYKDGEYSTAIPAFLLNPVGVEYYFSVNDYGNNRINTEVYVIEISNGVTPGYFQDFENDAIGFVSGGTNNTWEWGVPTSGPGSAYSGEKLIATNLAGDYSSSSNSFMQMPPIDLTELGEDDVAYLTFWHWYNTENNYDKLSIHIASDNSDGEFVKILEYTGDGQSWRQQFIDLAPYVGQQVHLRFYLNSDGSVVRAGWYIDDIALFGADDEAPAAPTNLSANTNNLGQVYLEWDRVIEHDMKDYVIFRSNESGVGFEQIGISSSTTYKDQVESGTYYYVVKARDYSNNLSEASNEVSIGIVAPDIIFSDDFDSDTDNGWTHSGAGDVWERGVPTSGPMSAVSQPNVWATNLSGNYNPNSNNQLVSPVIDLNDVDNATLIFDHWYKIETNYDKGFVEITNNGGTSWSELAMFTHSTNGMQWDEVILDLTPHVGNDVQIRYRLTSDGSVSYEGWYIDNFRILSAVSAEDERTQSDAIIELEKDTKEVEIITDQLQKTMDKSLYSVKGTSMIQPAALPIGATVTVLETGRSTKTDPATGSFSMVHSSGDFTLRAETHGYYPAEQRVSVINDETVIANFQLEPLPTGTITGTVTDERSGETIADATIVLSDPRIAPVTSDANGEFTLTALAGDYALTVFAEGYTGSTIDISIEGNKVTHVNVQLKPFIGFEGVIGYDDGSAEDAVVLNVSGGFGVRMTPEYPTAQVEGALLRFWTADWPSPGGTAIQIAIYDVGSDGMPGEMIAGPVNGTAKRDGTWTEVDFENAVTVNGDFYLVYLQVGLNPNAPGIALDTDPPNHFRSFMLGGGAWEALPTEYGNLMMRAKVKYPVGAPVIVSPEDGSFTNEENVTVTVASQAEGSTMNLYNGEEIVGTGSVANGQTEIDIILHEGENVLSAQVMVDGKLSDRSAPVTITLDQEAPELTVTEPVDGFKSNLEVVHVKGTVSDEHLDRLFVNDQEVNINEDGSFTHRVMLDTGENIITVRAVDKAGNETVVTRTVDANFEREFEITNVEPAEDLHINGGDSITVSFESIEGLDASFKIELDLSIDMNGGIKMTESSPGYYEGTWTAPINLNVNGAIIVISATNAYGSTVTMEAPGKLNVTMGDGGGEDPDPDPAGPVNVGVSPSKPVVELGEVFTIDLPFSAVEDLYAVEVTLIYDEGLTKGSVQPSAELVAHLEAHNPGASIISDEKVTSLGNGKSKSDFLLTLVGEIDGYSGTGSFGTYSFSSNLEGEFEFEIVNVRLLNSQGEDIKVGEFSSAIVTVVDTGTIEGFEITGQITAEALGEGVDFSEVWYSGSDGIHKVVVEAVDEAGQVIGLATINSDGTYSIIVPEEGNYTIRVYVPGHFEASETVKVAEDLELNFGPLMAGDVNGDGIIDLVDLQQAARAFGKKSPWDNAQSSAADFNRDGEIDLLDISYILNNFGARK